MRAWNLYWLIWFLASFTAFLGPEIYGLCTDARRTLSETIWRMEDLHSGESFWSWSAAHYLFTGVFILVAIWLIGHFGWGIWR